MTRPWTLSPRQWFSIALFNLVLAGVAGIILRWAFVQEIPGLPYRNLVHGHSHTAMIGWGYLGLLSLIVAEWWSALSHKKLFTTLFVLNEIAVVGMFVSFPIYGYKHIPILFTSIHLILTYFLAYYLWKDLAKSQVRCWSIRFIKSAFLFQILSTIGIWLLPVIIAFDGRNSALYHMCVQFFLHFQFNGWYIFAILGLFLKILEKNQITNWKTNLNSFHHLLFTSCFLTYALAITWSQPIQAIFWVNSLGVLLQLLALWQLIRISYPYRTKVIRLFHGIGRMLLLFASGALVLKMLIQAMVMVPAVAIMAYTIKNFVIGFIHLILLGILTTYLMAHAAYNHWMPFRAKRFSACIFAFLMGIILTEMLLFVQGIMLWLGLGFIPHYDLLLAIFSIALWSSILAIAFVTFMTNVKQ